MIQNFLVDTLKSYFEPSHNMIRPLDEALIDFQKTYRETFKEPLYEHQEYTKRQLIYNYATVGSEFIHNTSLNQLKNNFSKPRDLEQLINLWNDPMTKPQHVITQPIKKVDEPLFLQEQDQIKTFQKQVEVLKKQKMIIKNRQERNIFFRKQIEILFKTKNLNMLSVDSMRSHQQQLKPYLSYNSRNRVRKDRESEKPSSRHNDEYRQNHGRNGESRQNNRRYDQRQDLRRKQDRENQRKNDYDGRWGHRKEELREKSRQSQEHRDYTRKRESFERSQGYYVVKNTGNYYSPEQYSAKATPYSVSQFGKTEQAYSSYIPMIEISSSLNQNYQPGSYEQPFEQSVVYMPPPQNAKNSSFYQYDSNINSQYSLRLGSSEVHKQYQEK